MSTNKKQQQKQKAKGFPCPISAGKENNFFPFLKPRTRMGNSSLFFKSLLKY